MAAHLRGTATYVPLTSMDDLTATQKVAVSQLQALTNGEADVAISFLQTVDWDVQRAAELVFDHPSTSDPSISPRPPSPRAHIEVFEMDDLQQGVQNTRRRDQRRRRSYSFLRYFPAYPNSLFTIITFPFQLISSIFRLIFGVLRIPLPYLPFTSLSFYRPLPSGPSDPRSVADRWVRALEDDTGAICISRAATNEATAVTGIDAGPSSIAARSNAATAGGEARKLLPDFLLESYEEVLRICQRDAKIACVILVSEEHDDVPEFKRSTLTNPAFVHLLHDNNIIVWGGDVRDKEAWSAAQKLQATTYPFVAFLAMQPRRGPAARNPSTSSSTPLLTILSRHQGRSVPASAPTSAATLTDHVTRQLIPRVSPFLDRIKATARERERDRTLREEQDRAFKDSARRDTERIHTKMREEKRITEAKKRAEEEAKAEEERRVLELAESAKKDTLRMEWRRWARRTLIKPEASPITKGALRIAIRLPGGDGRSIRFFSPEDSLTSLYAYVDSQFITEDLSSAEDPTAPPQGLPSSEADIGSQAQSESVDDWWGFKLVLAYPRQELVWAAGKNLGTVDGLKGGAQIVVEKAGRHRSGSRASSPAAVNEDDEYESESD